MSRGISTRRILAGAQSVKSGSKTTIGTPLKLPASQNLLGDLLISSTNPISAIGLRFRRTIFSTLPVTSLSGASPVPQISSGVGGSGAVILPQFAVDGGWASEIVIINTGSSTVTVRVDLFKQD